MLFTLYATLVIVTLAILAGAVASAMFGYKLYTKNSKALRESQDKYLSDEFELLGDKIFGVGGIALGVTLVVVAIAGAFDIGFLWSIVLFGLGFVVASALLALVVKRKIPL